MIDDQTLLIGKGGTVAPLHGSSRDMYLSSTDSDTNLVSSDERTRKKSVININTGALYTTGKPEVRDGLLNVRALFFLILWYFFSGCTLFLNKYILSYTDADPTILGTFQMLTTTVCGFIQLYIPCGMYKPSQRLSRPPGFYKHMTFVGCTRFTTVILGLVSLNYVAVSFTETIKSSAPIFTVIISRILLGEHTGLYVNLSLIPVMGGLALCSINELSFDFRGFLAAMATNLTECLQNVYSKMLISGENFKYTPAELQFYTSMASVVVQIPASVLLVDLSGVRSTTTLTQLALYVLNGVFFHFQSITAYVLMDYISPVTHSVANTAKRAFLIWLSVLMFGNDVTVLSGLGTCTVIVGVLLYNKAQQIDLQMYSKLVKKEHSGLPSTIKTRTI
ncbi:solute carrier family 35 member E2B-like [Macrosteles quadrilineatus]|uniref:solute carrier family 35 member E2B-like n=1 Tax=Macrosteles quadrilineatus TaxID=74068 RepID=UPI0023E0C536|nr:solute carrier family 35 member E2B-like [Macrosteles quadrilineatus]